ncbi:response regulator [Paenibacillus sp. VCA1]|uniref:response regulator transcription factor n=1 Tax=Paenibacillus sp. VCA1 TaxID=3039148 RepID=UPI00287167AB|nr:response regulator [Paenibacillus sp. VCA1]MDR9856346.1 response regulator [Paenibacillus sp. VCA1]
MRYKVLLIDDEPGALEGMQLWIDWARLGFDVCGTSGNGADGLNKIRELKPDLVVTDIHMPLLDGLEMIDAWQKEGDRNVMFAIVSGYSEFEYARRAMRHGITHFLLKPVDQEEAEKELEAAYRELCREREKQRITRIAAREETVTLVKKAALNEPLSSDELDVLGRLSAAKEAWNFCLVQCDPPVYARMREIAAAVLRDREAMYLVDIGTHSFGIVYGVTPSKGAENESLQVLEQLSEAYSPYRVFMSTGLEARSLTQLERCLQTAKEAIRYNFYDSGYGRIRKYESVQARSCQYHYDQVRLIDRMTGALNVLDAAGFCEAVASAAESFRQAMVEPETVKNTVIHLMYQMMDHLSELGDERSKRVLDEYYPFLLGLSEAVIHLGDLMDCLLVCGNDAIELLSREQALKSQGIIQEINEYIRAHFREPLTIRKLAELFYLHPVYLGQLLIRKNGIGFNELVHNFRIEEAAVLLKEGRLKNSEIAESVGYANYGQFLKHFEKRMGMSPNEFKAKN